MLRTKARQNEGEPGRRSAWPGVEVLIEIVAETSGELLAVAEALDEDREVDLQFFDKTYPFP